MSERDTLIADLQRTRELLTAQLDTISMQAASQHLPPEALRTTDGGYVAVPVLCALAQVQVALLDVAPIIEERPTRA